MARWATHESQHDPPETIFTVSDQAAFLGDFEADEVWGPDARRGHRGATDAWRERERERERERDGGSGG